ncbi:MAG: CBS domain-containing protein [Peptococcaceae bacterium]|nr:CBS domain-containing protein [Peptococcaceae bacterium]
MKIKAADVMVPIGEYPVIADDEYIDRAAALLVQKYASRDSAWQGYECLIVTDKLNQKTGILSLRAILKAIGKNGPAPGVGSLFAKKRGKGAGIPVRSLMRPLHAAFVEINDDAEQAARIIMENRVNSVPVYDGNNPVGIIRTIDLFWFIEEML